MIKTLRWTIFLHSWIVHGCWSGLLLTSHRLQGFPIYFTVYALEKMNWQKWIITQENTSFINNKWYSSQKLIPLLLRIDIVVIHVVDPHVCNPMYQNFGCPPTSGALRGKGHRALSNYVSCTGLETVLAKCFPYWQLLGFKPSPGTFLVIYSIPLQGLKRASWSTWLDTVKQKAGLDVLSGRLVRGSYVCDAV